MFPDINRHPGCQDTCRILLLIRPCSVRGILSVTSTLFPFSFLSSSTGDSRERWPIQEGAKFAQNKKFNSSYACRVVGLIFSLKSLVERHDLGGPAQLVRTGYSVNWEIIGALFLSPSDRSIYYRKRLSLISEFINVIGLVPSWMARYGFDLHPGQESRGVIRGARAVDLITPFLSFLYLRTIVAPV